MEIMYGVATYLYSQGNVLMVKIPENGRGPNAGLYTLPGGKLENHEKGLLAPEGRSKAAARETRLETGLQILDPVLRGVILFDNSERIFPNWKEIPPQPPHYEVYYFYSNRFLGTLLRKGDEGEEPLWVKEYDIPHLPKNSGDRLVYSWLRLHNNKPFKGVIKHVGTDVDESRCFVDFFDPAFFHTPQKQSLIRTLGNFVIESYKATQREPEGRKAKPKTL